LQRNNEELSRQLLEAEKTLQDKLANYDTELDEAQHKLEELRSELSASNREEKDLRTKDVRSVSLSNFSRANDRFRLKT
jgi:phage shock protein A